MKIDEALYQLKQNIKMHELEGTTSNQNEREKALLDHITNSQTIEREYSAILSENAELENKITNLQEENEIVHKDFAELSERYFFTKSRIDEAVEHIKRNTKNNTFYEYCDGEVKDLLNILQGSDK